MVALLLATALLLLGSMRTVRAGEWDGKQVQKTDDKKESKPMAVVASWNSQVPTGSIPTTIGGP